LTKKLINFKHELADLQKGLSALEQHEKHPLEVYRPTEWQLPIHESPSSEVIVRGGKRSGKTCAVVLEIASRILGIPITRQDGTKIPLRFRAPKKNNPGLYWVIGFDINHIGQTLYHRLFSPGLGDGAGFRIIQDASTGKWRSYNPNTDKERYNESELSPPLFGPHLVDPKSWHYESRAGNVFRSVRLKNGATICAYPSTGDSPKKGDAVDGIWIDEDIEKGEFLKEWQDRLATSDGWFLWSVWPQVANEALLKTLERGEREKDNPKRPIEVFALKTQDNPFSDVEGVAKMKARMDDDDDEAHRAEGDISAFISGRQMYNFGSAIHMVKPEPFQHPTNPWQVVCDLLGKDSRLPKDWTRYLVIDPSHTRTACLVGVVPPPDFWDLGNRLIIEEEIIVRKYTPAQFASHLRERVGGFCFESFIMDQMMGRQQTVAADMTVFAKYGEEFRAQGITSRVTGYGFMRGSNDKALRRRSVRDLMEPTEQGWPRLWFSSRCPVTMSEMRKFRKKEVKDPEGRPVPTDDGAAERLYDAVMCVEYLAEYIHGRFRDGTAYIEPDKFRSHGSGPYHAAQAILTEINKSSGYAHYGPGAAA
jgi:hypothetical protein